MAFIPVSPSYLLRSATTTRLAGRLTPAASVGVLESILIALMR